MIIFPAIDLKNGQCVRLKQGDFDAVTIYESDPLKMAASFAAAGADWVHVVDLDGAKAGHMQQFDIIASIARNSGLKVQSGGGIRDEKTIRNLLDAGVTRVVVGSLAVKNRPLVQSRLREFGGDKIILAFDIRYTPRSSRGGEPCPEVPRESAVTRNSAPTLELRELYNAGEPEILTQGWQSGSQQLLWDVLDAYADSGLTSILCTDVSRDGMLQGANNALYQSIRQRWPEIEVLASGGVSGLPDLLELARLGASGAIVGKAIYEGRINLAEAIQQVKHAG